MTKTPRRSRAGLGRAFRLVQLSTGMSGVGDGLVLAAFPLLAARLTDDPRLIVAVTVAARLPWLLVSLPAGALVDRLDRRRLVVGVEVGRAGVLGAFAIAVMADRGALGALLATVFLIGVGQTVIVSATHAVLPEIVHTDDLGQANGALAATEAATEDLIGPALGGILFAAAAALPFVIDGISFAVAAALLAVALPATSHAMRTAPASRLRTDIADGFRFFIHEPVLRIVGGLVALLAFCQAMVFGPLVLFALNGLGLSDAGYGLLLAGAALGTVFGGTVASRLDRRFGPGVLLAASGVAAAGAYALCGVASTAVLAGLALAGEGVAVAVGNVTSLTLRQRITPNELLGRVGNVMRFFIFGAIPLGALAGGFLVQWLGVRAPFAGAAVLQLLAVVIMAPTLVRRLRPTVQTSAA